jgi:prepilin-type N-terminal cleavage/methylation domain-containing protein
MLQNTKGFTLVEMIIVMAVFIVVIFMTASSFNTILTQSGKLMQSEENNIEGVVGLEMLRHDIEQAGFGLPWVSMSSYANYDDAEHPLYTDLDLPNYNEVTSAPHKEYNDGLPRPTAAGTPASCRIPRAVVSGDNLVAGSGTYGIVAGTDYLAIKATTLGRNVDSQRWTYINYSGTVTPFPIPPTRWLTDNIRNSAGVIITRRELVDNNGISSYAPMLIYDPANTTSLAFFSQPFPSPGNAFPEKFSPLNKTQIYYVYGVDNPGNDLSMPFNRVNYFIAKPSDTKTIPAYCAPNTGILYRTTVSHSDNGLTYMPVLDCVADMQIVLGFNFNDSSGTVNVFSNADGSTVSNMSGSTVDVPSTLRDANLLRDRLKVVKIYILAQEGRIDTSYTSKNTILVGGSGESALTKNYDLVANNATHYRWKMYQIIARPKNLMSNQ